MYANCFIGEAQYGADRFDDCKNVRFDAFVDSMMRVELWVFDRCCLGCCGWKLCI